MRLRRNLDSEARPLRSDLDSETPRASSQNAMRAFGDIVRGSLRSFKGLSDGAVRALVRMRGTTPVRRPPAPLRVLHRARASPGCLELRLR